jgi:predicted GIY-YIG superfamily endonuclease
MAKGESPVASRQTRDDELSSRALLPASSPERSPSPPVDPGSLTPLSAPTPSRSKRGSRARSSAPAPYLRRTPKANKSTFLYRFYDEDGVLLYVGITDNLIDRTWSHARASTWMEFAMRSTVVPFTSRAEAEEHEVLAIRSERPLFNLAYNDDQDGDRRVVDYLIEHDRRDLLRPAVSRG